MLLLNNIQANNYFFKNSVAGHNNKYENLNNFSNINFGNRNNNYDDIFIPSTTYLDNIQETNTNNNVIIIPDIRETDETVNTNNSQLTKTVCELKNPEIIKKELNKNYGIEIASNIKNPELLSNIQNAVEDFCKISNSKKLFKGLKIGDKCTGNVPSSVNINEFSKKVRIEYNQNFDWSKLKDYTQSKYDEGKICSNNPKYYLYEPLASYLLLNGKNLTKKDLNKNLKDEFNSDLNNKNLTQSEKFNIARMQERFYALKQRFSSSDNLYDILKSYITVKMCEERIPKDCDILFNLVKSRLGTDVNLKYPEVKSPEKTDRKFSSVEHAKSYLLKKYGIEADLPNLNYANSCVEAVEDLTQALDDETFFNGLKIETNGKYMEDKKTFGMVVPYKRNSNNEFERMDKILSPIQAPQLWEKLKQCPKDDFKAEIELNPEIFSEERAENLYNNGGSAASNIKGLFTHELSHYIAAKSNPYNFLYATALFFSNEETLNAAYRVSSYAATEDANEYLAEYITGRMSGQKYPEIVNKQFYNIWDTYFKTNINFPDMT